MTINSLPALISEFKLDRSHAIMCSLMQMVTDYMKLHLLMGMLQEAAAKTTLAFHLFAHQVLKRSAEPSAEAVQMALKRFEKPITVVALELQGIADVVRRTHRPHFFRDIPTVLVLGRWRISSLSSEIL
jgi:hypothetical protein